jgi:RHS repeat-associated protein
MGMTIPAPAGQSGYETTTYTYDGAGHVITTTAPPATGSTSQVTYDTYNTAGQPATQTTSYGTSAASTTSYCYDPNGDRTAVVMPDGNTTSTAACETSSPWVVSSSSYPAQAAYQTTSAYDSVGELVSATSPATAAAPSGATTTGTFDAAGNMLTRTDPNGVKTTWTYTPANLAATASYSGSSAHSVTYTYDANGQKTAMTDATGSSAYVWDPFAEQSSAQNGAGQTTTYAYDADGNTTGITYPLPGTATWAATRTVVYGYNNADVLNSVTDFNNHQITITPNADSLPATVALGSTGDAITTTYDPANAPSTIAVKNGSTTLQSFTYSDAPAGNILSETDTPASSKSPAVYTYDPKGRVTSMTAGSGPALNYAFDASSNLTTTPTGATATYDHNGEITSSTLAGTSTNYAYDADGHRLTATQNSTTVASGTWNGAGQLTAYTSPAASMTAATYDGNGLRASTTSTSAQAFTWRTNGQLPLMLMDSTNAYIFGSTGTPTEQVSLATGTITYLVADSLGSVRGTVSTAGTLTATTAYDAWGNPETAGGLTATTPFGYAGGYTDATGLLYLISRYYDPATGQFMSVDPEVSQTLAPYGYAGGDPVTVTDPTGCNPCRNVRYRFLWSFKTATHWGPWHDYAPWWFDNVYTRVKALFDSWFHFAPGLSFSWDGLSWQTSYYDQYYAECINGQYIVSGWRENYFQDYLLVSLTAHFWIWHWTVFSGWWYDILDSRFTGGSEIYYAVWH